METISEAGRLPSVSGFTVLMMTEGRAMIYMLWPLSVFEIC